jgi:oligopeptide/dipeptide ABC transporter ATP-binding protein
VIFVTHDIGVAIEVADHIAVMYAGHIVEIGDCRDVVRAPAHPYTQGLLAAGADRALGKGANGLVAIPGTSPDLAKLPPGCAFAPRCGQARAMCEEAKAGRLLGSLHGVPLAHKDMYYRQTVHVRIQDPRNVPADLHRDGGQAA